MGCSPGRDRPKPRGWGRFRAGHISSGDEITQCSEPVVHTRFVADPHRLILVIRARVRRSEYRIRQFAWETALYLAQRLGWAALSKGFGM